MSRTTPRKEPQRVRESDLQVDREAASAVSRAMQRAHDRNPAKYHKDRPNRPKCDWDASCPFTTGATE